LPGIELILPSLRIIYVLFPPFAVLLSGIGGMLLGGLCSAAGLI
jgi:hypothetical protein